MLNRPFSDEDIERLKTTVYVPQEPLHPLFVVFFVIFWPLGLFYLLLKLDQKAGDPVYLLSLCQSDEMQERLFAFLKKKPRFKKSFAYLSNNDRYIPGTSLYNITNMGRIDRRHH